MNDSCLLRSELPLGPVTQNIGTLLIENGERFKSHPAFAQKENGIFRYWSWSVFLGDIFRFSSFLAQLPLGPKDRVTFITQKSYLRLVSEMAVMSMGMTSVPIFRGYGKKMKSELLKFSEASLLVLDHASEQDEIERGSMPKHIFSLNDFYSLRTIGSEKFSLQSRMSEVSSDQTAIVLFTSGTSGFPKGVMLTHRNILSQQKANEILWNLKKGMRFLSYLPWDHVFGALFERFFSLTNGGCLCLDDSEGKNIDLMLKNFQLIRPHVFFSIPLVYEKLVEKISTSTEASSKLHHPDLKFLFTAAAPLSAAVLEIFQEKGIPMVEGWGLTEASPSCTLTKPLLHGTPGNVGFPIPGVEIRLGSENEILVRGHNVMKGYFKSSETTDKVIDEEGWLHTGDIGEIAPEGLRIIGRKDRVFKLSNGKKVSPQLLEDRLKNLCRYVKYVYVFGHGMKAPCALIFPDFTQVPQGDLEKRVDYFSDGLKEVNRLAGAKYERIGRALIMKAEPTLEGGELTPSMKLRHITMVQKYKKHMDFLASGVEPVLDTIKIEIDI